MPRTIAFIPVRSGSKGIPDKNIKSFCGKPLVYWTVKAASNVKKIDEVVVALDSNEIENVVKAFRFPKVNVYRRKPENALDTSSTESVMLEYIDYAHLNSSDIFILIQATSPFTQSADLEKALEYFNESNSESLLSASRVKRFFWDEKGNPLNYDFEKRPRRQDFKGQFIENGAFYINTVDNIVRYKNRLSGKIAVFPMPEYTWVEIDEPVDWIIAETLMRKFILKQDAKRKKPEIKLFLSDIDGVLTDSGMYYSENGDELKKFNTKDGRAFEILRNRGIKTGLITSENRKLNQKRAEKLKVDYLFQGAKDKLSIVKKLCEENKISLETEVAYIGDDLNDIDLLSDVALAACPSDAVEQVKTLGGINVLKTEGGHGAVREFVEELLME